MYKLKGRSFWDVLAKQEASWSWRKILSIRGLIREHFVHKIGNGKDTSLWFDNWHPLSPLNGFISNRKIHAAGFSMDSKVADVINNGDWSWPKTLTNEFDGLLQFDPPNILDDKADKVK